MQIADPRSFTGPGVFPLQHQKFSAQNFQLDMRSCMLAARVLRRDIQGGGAMGHWIYEEQTLCDIIGGAFWPITPFPKTTNPGQQPREMAAWRFAWPVMTVKREDETELDVSGILGPRRQGVCRFAPIPQQMRPLWNQDYHEDQRFSEVDVSRPRVPLGPDRGKVVWRGRFPYGWFGIMLAADVENQQEDLYLPADPRVAAVNYAGDPSMGTTVVDLKEDFTVDRDRTAWVQSAWRVIVEPKGCFDAFKAGSPGEGRTVVPGQEKETRCDIAWQLYDAGCRDIDHSFGGFVFDGISRRIAHVGELRSGPVGVGAERDKHHFGKDLDGNPINAAHINTNAYFYTDVMRDAPLEFSNIPYPDPPIGPDRVKVFLSYDDDSKHKFFCGTREGLWRWWSTSFDCVTPGIPEPPSEPPPSEGDAGQGQLGPPPGNGGQGFLDRASPADADLLREAEANRGGIRALPTVGRASLSERRVVSNHIERALPSLLFRPHRLAADATDIRNVTNPNVFGVKPLPEVKRRNGTTVVGSEEKKEKTLTEFLRRSPVVARMESVGAESEDGWKYKNRPGKMDAGRYPLPSGPGVVVFMPAELGLEDYFDGTFTDKDKSVACFAIAPGARFCFGVPSRTRGAVEGNYLEWNDTTSELELRNDQGGTTRLILSVDVDGVVTLRDAATVPAADPVDGVKLFSEDGFVRCRGKRGTVTTMAPP